MKPKVFLTRELPPDAMDRLKSTTDLDYNRDDRVLTQDEIVHGVQGKDFLLCLLTDRIDSTIMDANPDLHGIVNYAVGFNNVDIEAAKQRGIPVTNTPGVLTDTSADMAFALLMAIARRIPEADNFIRTGTWEGWGPLQFLGADVNGATVGIIGLGRIGKAFVRRTSGFDMEVVYWNRTRLTQEEERLLGVKYLAFDDVLGSADFVSIHVAYNADTHHLISTREFELMQPGAYLINTSRGPVVDEKALVIALQQGQIKGAALDVFENEPRIEAPLLEMKNVVLVPHLASATIETRTRMAMKAIDNLLAIWEGRVPPNLVN